MSKTLQCSTCGKRFRPLDKDVSEVCPACSAPVAPERQGTDRSSLIPWIAGGFAVSAFVVVIALGLWNAGSAGSAQIDSLAVAPEAPEGAARVELLTSHDDPRQTEPSAPPMIELTGGSALVQPIADVQISAGSPKKGSDFDPSLAGEAPVSVGPPTSMPATAPAERGLLLDDRGVQDVQIGAAIERGVNYLLQQFEDGQLKVPPELSEVQRQALDALCVYAFAQAGQAANDPRLSLRNSLFVRMLDRLGSFGFSTDGKTLNAPITYARSLRIAALATLNRPTDVPVMKADCAWLIVSQVGGTYSYDDTGAELAKAGLKLNTSEDATGGMGAGAPLRPRTDPQTQPSGNVAFGGGSREPVFDGGSYGPPISPLPPIGPIGELGGGTSSPPPGADGTNIKLKNDRPLEQGNVSVRPVRPVFPVRPHMFHTHTWRPEPRLSGMAGGGKGLNGARLSKGGGGGRPAGTGDAVGDNEVPPPDVRVDFPWDNSNSQYGLLGVWAGAEVGMEVPDAYWQSVEKHWIACQLRTGEWAYKNHEMQGYFAMTCAGVASLLVTHDYLDLPMLKGAVGREPYNPSLAAGLKWLDAADNGVNTPNPNTHYLGYDLFGIERVGLASGYKYFGSHDWYRELAEKALASQFANGSWGHDDHGLETLVDTAYTLLFLARGRHPIIMTKLKFDGAWDNRPRDVANLAKFSGKELERPLNWQVVDINHPWYDWFDSPVVFIASHQAPKLSDRNYTQLKNFVQAGGLIFTQADVASMAFDKWVSALAQKIAPDHPLEPIPDTDPIYSIQYKLKAHHRLMGVRNGIRWLIVHSPSDVAMAWQQRSDKTRLADFQLGTNVFLYASGKPDLRNRISSPYIPPPTAPSTRAVRIARLTFHGNWDPEPAAWGRFSRYMQWETGISPVIGTVAASELTPGIATLATLTGTGTIQLTNKEQAAIRNYVTSGGTLLIDPCGGDASFRLSVQASLKSLLTEAQPMTIPPGSQLLKDLPTNAGTISLKLRPYTLDKYQNAATATLRILKLGQGQIIFSPHDLTFGLLGVQTWGIDGYVPEDSQLFVRNLVVEAMSRS